MARGSRLREAARQLVPGSVVADVRRWRMRRHRRPGLPGWTDEETIRGIVREKLGGELTSSWFSDLSGYKEQSAAKLWLTAKGRSMTLVTKRVRDADSGYFAIEGFPGPVGAPERQLYARGPGPLEPWTPELFVLDASPDGETQYYFEDLLRSHHKATGPHDLIELTGFLIDLQEPLTEWLGTVPSDSVVRYDGDFPQKFMEYARDSLDAYATATDDEDCIRFLRRWDEVEAVYLGLDPGSAPHGVHGDFRKDNLFIRRRGTGFKAVDWEYAGYGWMHNDLTSVLKTADSEVASRALDLLASRRPEHSRDEHFELFQRCRLERGILDAALVAKQRMATSDNPYVKPDHYDLAVSAMNELKGAGSGA